MHATSPKPYDALPENIESIRLRLVHTPLAHTSDMPPAQERRQYIRYLIRALDHADATFANEIETLLTHVGQAAVPELLRALRSPSTHIRGVCAMVLIRIGQPTVAAIHHMAADPFYHRYAKRHNLTWVIEFILAELGEPIPSIARQETTASKAPVKAFTAALAG